MTYSTQRILSRRTLLAAAPAALAQTRAGTSYLPAVREFAANVLRYGHDTYGPKHTPLFVDGVDVETHEPVKWKARDGREWALSNLGNQQILFRTLSGLSALAGEPQWRTAAEEATRYGLRNLLVDGLLAWGGHTAYDASTDTIFRAEDKGVAHELKEHFPYYQLMWEVDRAATVTLIETLWNSHILDWATLDFNRHGSARPRGPLWKSEYKGGPVFFWGKGLTFLNAASDLIYAAAMLSRFTSDAAPLTWAKRLAHRYVETRNPKTGIGGYQFSQMASAWCDDKGDIRGDRAIYQYGDDFKGHVVYEGTLFPCYGNHPATGPQVCQMGLGEALGERGKEFLRWPLEEMTAWGKSAYRAKDHSFIPMLTDGASLEGYVCKKDGYFGPKGRVVTAGKAGAAELRAYAMAHRLTRDAFMWEMARSIAEGAGAGDLGATPGAKPSLAARTRVSEPLALLALLELHQATGRSEFLDAARRVGDNILSERFHRGYFLATERDRFVRFDTGAPLALLHLEAALAGKRGAVPPYHGGSGFFAAAYADQGHKYDEFLYRRKRG
jgi:pectate lyase